MEQKFNRLCIYFFYTSIIIYPLNILLSNFVKIIGFETLATKTIFACYLIVVLFEMYILYRFPISIKRLIILFLFYMLYFILYITSNDKVKHIFSSVDMVFIYFFYLPYAILILSRIKNFSILFSNKYINYLNATIIVTLFFAKYYLGDQTGYMPYSYNLLPIWIMFSFNYIDKPTITKTLVLLVMSLEGVIYGARGPLIWLAVSIIGYLILKIFEKETKFKLKITINNIIKFIISILIITISIFLFTKILSFLNIGNSYILNRFETGSLNQSSGRETMISIGMNYLREMGTNINGIFYDRTMMPGGIYVHNFILETLIAFGWIIGIVLVSVILWSIVKIFIVSNLINKKVMLLIVPAYFMKYFLTGSIYDDYSFIITMSIIFAIYKQEKPDKYIIRDKI